MEIANNFQNQELIAAGYYLKGKLAQNKGDYKAIEIEFTKCLKIHEKRLSCGIDDTN